MDTQNAIILDALTAAAGGWVPMPELVARSGSYNVHSRVDELRHKRGINILNRTERDRATKHRKLSFYSIPIETPKED
jgi:hypothetical protein